MSPLNCNEFESRLRESVETRSLANAAMRAHFAECQSCAVLWTDYELLNEAVSAWNVATPRVDLADRVVNAWRAERAPAVQPRAEAPAKPATGILAVVTVAVLLLAVTLLATRRDATEPGTKPGTQSVIAKTEPKPTPDNIQPKDDDSAVDVEQMVAGFRTQMTGLTKDVSMLVAGVKVEWPAIETNLLGNDPKTKPPTQPKTVPKSSGWKTGLDPIQRDVRKAFGFLRQAIPSFEDPST